MKQMNFAETRLSGASHALAGEAVAEKPAPFRARQEATIGDLAREFGVTLRTLRFYEDKGLLHPRRQGMARYYGGPDRFRLQMILKGKQLGFTLAEIGELVGDAAAGPEADFETCLKPDQVVNQIDHLERQRVEIDQAISRLKATRAQLAEPQSP